ncbi:MAG TPA: superinfection immunity protein [Anaerolineae bacterium]|nr:superinfection immunity protein [Anaerolineae bacterium]
MALTPARPQPINEDFATTPRESDAQDDALLALRAAPKRKRSRRLPLWLVFVVGLLLGWFAIGWWLWPIEWTNSTPWQLRPSYQKTYVTLVAEEYNRTVNLAQVETALAGWSRQELAGLLSEMQNETTDPDRRAHLAELAQVLTLPAVQTSLLESLLSQNGILIGMLLAIVPLLVALVLAVGPRLRARQAQAEAQAETLELEEALGGIDAQPEQPSPDSLDEVVIGGQPDEGETALEGSGASQEKGDEEQDPEQVKEQEAEEPSAVLGDLASLFEEEDTTLTSLEALIKDLPDISADELYKTGTKVADQLRKGSRRRTAEKQT